MISTLISTGTIHDIYENIASKCAHFSGYLHSFGNVISRTKKNKQFIIMIGCDQSIEMRISVGKFEIKITP